MAETELKATKTNEEAMSEENSDAEALQELGIKEPLVASLQVILSFYGMHADVDGLIDDSAREDAKFKIGDLPALAKKMNFSYEEGILSLDELKEVVFPCLLQLKDGSLCVHFPHKTHGGKIYKPDVGVIEERITDFAELFEGRAYVMTPKKSTTDMSISHMIRGHAIDWFWQPIVSYWPRYMEVVLCSLFINLFVVALPLFTLNVYDRVVPNYATSTLIALTIGISIALVFDFFFKTARSYILERVASKVGAQYDFDLMERLLHIKTQELNFSLGEKVNIFRELQGIRDFYATRLAPTVVDVPFLLLFLGIIFLISPTLVIPPVVGSIVIFTVNIISQVPNNRATEQYFSSMQNKTSSMVETLSGAETFRMFNAVGSRLFKWGIASTRAAEAMRYNQFIRANITNFSMSVLHFVHVFVIFLGVFEIQSGNLSIGGLIACSILSARAIAPIMSLSSVLTYLRQSLDVLITIDKMFQLDHEQDDIASKSPKGPFKGKMELRNVVFQYGSQTRPAVNDVSVVINAGDNVGFIGRTGAGKSTTAKLLSGFITPESGEIMLDGFSIDSIPPTELRRTVGIVPQKSFFFNGTIRENVLVGREDIDPKALDKAVGLSGLDIVMQQTGLGLDMDVGENGERLSGGQQQAISLARAFIRDPQILIFDEPTNGMDSVLEGRVKQTLSEFLNDRTFIMVTHRTTLLPLVDTLVFMDDGKVALQGPRDQVLNKISGQGGA